MKSAREIVRKERLGFWRSSSCNRGWLLFSSLPIWKRSIWAHCYGRESFSSIHHIVPLNHGSYGAFPKVVRAKQRELQDQTEARSDPFIRFTIPKLLRESRNAMAPLLGASMQEVVFMPNATTGINTVLRNLKYEDSDIILYLSTAYGACEKTILHVCETTPRAGSESRSRFSLRRCSSALAGPQDGEPPQWSRQTGSHCHV